MLGTFKRLFGPSDSVKPAVIAEPVELPSIRPPAVLQSVIEPTPIAQPGPRHDGTPVPYYPRKGPAVPAASPDKLVATQSELIRQLRQASALSFDEFDRYIRPVIDLYAAFVHLLPASEYDHHSDLGGLFRHGLEVALNTCRRAEGKEFALNEDPCVRKFQIFRWRACALLGGLMHDLGKAVIDVGAVDETGNLVWNPHVQPLWAWIQEHELDHYTIAWRQGRRHREHDAISATALVRLMPNETMRWMGEYRGRAAYDAMLMALTGGGDPSNQLTELIKNADIDSVKTDREASHRRLASIGEAGSRGHAVLLVRAMRERILQGDWQVNQVGSPIWFTADGLFAMYPQCANEAVEQLRVSGITSITNQPPKIVDILHDAGIISSGTGVAGNSYNVHRIKVHATTPNGETRVLDISVLKFANEHIIPDYYAMPPAVEVEMLEPDGTPRAQAAGTVQPYVPAAPMTPERAAKWSANFGKGKKAAAATSTAAPAPAPAAAAAEPQEEPVANLVPATPHVVHHHDERYLSDEDEIEPTPLPDSDAGPTPDPTTPLRDWANEPDARDALIAESLEIARNPFPPTSADGAKRWLAQQNNGIFLADVIERAESGELKWEQHLFDREDLLHIAFPEALEGCGTEPAILRDAFLKDGWIEPDPARPNRPTVPLTVGKEQVSCLRFSHGVSLALTLLLPAKPEAQPAQVDQGPYIRGRASRLYSGTLAKIESDGPIVRLAFHTFLTEKYNDRDATWVYAAPAQLKSLAHTFAKQHKMEASLLRRLLKHGNNPLLLPLPELEFNPNPSYSHEVDERLFNALDQVPAEAVPA